MVQDIGTGTGFTFATSSFAADILEASHDGISRPAIDTSHMLTTAFRTFIPGKLTDPGSLQISFAYDPDQQPPINGAAETITITFPLPAGKTTAATLVGTAFLTDFAPGIPLEDKMTASATFKFSGTITFTDSAV